MSLIEQNKFDEAQQLLEKIMQNEIEKTAPRLVYIFNNPKALKT